ncbi:MAG TPA: GTP 3',8-cyclase MoaA [Syntrophomonadaceae bacterium]|nr:GTP 3',8-cyclase MoaA [Syntrophomonadaceae bacterium]HQA08340.1 GTP 3',8-cyclase MoaA [Syntrophomonadaceae bacterium]HQE22811.1 GTP 3',8-cyclase MoaA [Syntrophomonadaceae bacterium]
MVDSFGRHINYLRISVTDRCNLRCQYCMPEDGVQNLGHGNILSLEDLARLARIGAQVGIRKVRLTGGEPLVRKNITGLIRCIADIPEIDDIALTTNGILFPAMAQDLKAAGLKRVNISMDTMKEERFAYITRRGGLNQVREAVFKALELDMHPVKINVVVIRGFNDDEIGDFARLAYDYPLHVRFIEYMPVGDLLFWNPDRMMSSQEILDRLKSDYELNPEKAVEGNGPARYYHIAGGAGSLGFISPMSHQFCSECNRIRLTADGKLRGCLYAKQEVDLKAALDRGAYDEELQELFLTAIKTKPAHHEMNSGWGQQNFRKMYQIGG